MSEPGRLRVSQELSRIRVEVPGEQFVVRASYWALVAFGASASAVLALVSNPSARGLAALTIALAIVLGMAWAGWKGLSLILRQVQYGRWWANVLLLGLLIILAAIPLILVLGGGMIGGLGLTLVLAAMYYLVVRLMAGRAAVVTIDQAAVTVEHRRSRVSVPLEKITTLTPARSWRHPATLGEQVVTGLSELTQAEWDWLERTIIRGVARRRAALHQEGHDLSTEARPPADLSTLTQR